MNQHTTNKFLLTSFWLIIFIGLQSYAQTPDTWTSKADFGGNARYGAVAFSIGTTGYMGTGYLTKAFWKYDSSTETWSQIANFGGEAMALSTGFSIGSKGYVGCGSLQSAEISKDFWEYDPDKDMWTRKADFAGVPRRGTFGFSIGAKGYMGGGRGLQATDKTIPHFNDFWEYDPSNGSNGTWTKKADFGGAARAFAASFTLGNKAYVGTGRTNSGFVNDFWEYDPSYIDPVTQVDSGKWTQRANFGGESRYGAVGMSIGAFGYIGTGATTSSGLSNDFWEYDPSNGINGTWTKKSDFSGVARFLAAAFSIGNKGYIGTGQINDTTYVNSKDFWEYTPPANWTGVTNSDWDISTNWLSGSVPSASTDVTIPIVTNNYPVIGSAAASDNLNINSGANLTIAPSKSLTVSGTLTNNAGNSGLVIKSDATGTGSLIHNTTGVNGTVERYLVGDWNSANSGWHLLSSPVASQAISGLTTSGTGNDYDFYGWDEASNLWMNFKAAGFSSWNGGANFNTGQGYMVSYEATHVGTFSGNINVGSITKSNLSLSSGANFSWHLLGNPYSSALKWNDGNWALNNVAGNAKIWNASNKSYSDIPAGGTIPMEQGFMISVANDTNSITIPAASRIISSTNWFKSTLNKYTTLIASEQDGSSYQESKILINTSVPKEFNFDNDSRFLAGYAPQFYSLKGDEKLSTFSLPSLNSVDVIQFGFIKNKSDNFKIELKEAITGQAYYLYDIKTDSVQDLSANPVYSFTSAEGDNPVRFNLYFQNIFTAVPELTTRNFFSMNQSDGNINIITNQAINAEIRVSNMLGQIVFSGKTNGNSTTTINSNALPNGVYIVSLIGNNNVYSKKIVLNN